MDSSQLQRIKAKYNIVGNNDALNRAIEIALKIAPVDLSVLIRGENGVGKEVFPRIIHDHSLRKNKKYFAVNCGAIPEGTIDSELFGHEKGAFTGAIEKREGYFSVANGGTLFLDEVAELPLATQARLLRVLETGEYIRVGSSEVQHTNVRIVAATNVDIEHAIKEGKFREDLFYRLNSVSINIPPLRERGQDIVLLFRKFALEMSEKYHMPPVRLNEEAQQALMSYSWPGNVRQLKNIAESMSVTCEEREITTAVLKQYLPVDHAHSQLVPLKDNTSNGGGFENEREILYQILFDLRRDVSELKKAMRERDGQTYVSSRAASGNHADMGHEIGWSAGDAAIEEAELVTDEYNDSGNETSHSLNDLERGLIERVLQKNDGRRKQAALELGISERTLYRKIKEYGLE